MSFEDFIDNKSTIKNEKKQQAFLSETTPTIEKLKIGGFVNDSSDVSFVTIGGSKGVQYTVDKTANYINCKSLDAESFLQRNNLKPKHYRQRLKEMYPKLEQYQDTNIYEYDDIKYSDLFQHIMEKSEISKLLLKQFHKAIDCITGLEEYIYNKLSVHISHNCKKTLNLSISEYFIPPEAPTIFELTPEKTASILNQLIEAINKYNLKALTGKEVEKMQQINEFNNNIVEKFEKKIKGRKCKTASDYKQYIEELINAEQELCADIKNIEEYYIEAINKLDKIFTICDEYRKL